jgi:nicotinamide-nucleotide amidase
MFDDIFAAFYTLLVFACGVRSDTQHRNTPGISGTAVMSVSRLLDQLAIQAGAALSESSLMLATAESCTGGLVAAAITDVSGSSGWFERGFVTYSNEAKTTMVGVPAKLIRDHGAVSEEVARAMAEGALLNSRAQVSLAITGVAGPGGGTPRNRLAWSASAGATASPHIRKRSASRVTAPRSAARLPNTRCAACWN